MKTIKAWMVAAVLLFFTGGTIIGMAVVKKILSDLPDVEKLESYVPPLVTKILDKNGRPIGEFFTEKRTSVPITQIPVDLRSAVIAIEDTDFFTHWGVNPKAILRASFSNLLAGKVVQGGSTLTQQLAKTIFLTRQKTLMRKFRELLLTLQMENQYSKEEILQLYLNQIYFGGGAYGVEAAARLYFDKHVQELNLAECALLAGLVRSPNRYSPLNNPQLAQGRRATVLSRMRDLKFISEKEEAEANAAPISQEAGGLKGREAPYFVEEVRRLLEPSFGEEQIEQGGLTIQTTLDLDMQKAADVVLEKRLTEYDLEYATPTLAEYNKDLAENATGPVEISTVTPTIQGALVALDVHTGAVRALVGGRSFSDSQFNRITQAKRQPGSAFKAFVWAAALEGNFTPATIVPDYPLVYIDMESNPTLLLDSTSYAETESAILKDLKANTTNFGDLTKEEMKEARKRYWRPMDWDLKYRGPMTVREGIQRSRNIVSIRLTDNVGPRAVVKLAKKAGVRSWLNPVISLGLGTSVLTPMELVNAYATFPRGGLYAEPYYVETVKDRKGKIMIETTPKIEDRMSPQTSYLMVSLLRGVIDHGTGWYAKRIARPLGGKTGTTQDQRDLWFVGFSPDLVCGVWIGYDDFKPLKKGLTASQIAVPLWTDFMREALKGTPKSDFTIPPKIEFAKIDATTGYLALPTCPRVILEAFRQGTVPKEFCPVEHVVKEEEKVEEE